MNENAVVLKQTELLGQQFTVYGTKEEPLFLSKDVASMIEHSDVSTMMRTVDDDEKLLQTMFASGQKRQVWMLTENGLYEVLMQSRKPVAKEFKKGVKRILKEIRQNGGYIATTQEDSEETILAKALIIAQRTIEKQKAKIETIAHEKEKLKAENNVLLPDANYTKEVLKSDETYTMTQIAKEFGYTCQVFTEKLMRFGVIYKQSGQYMLTSKYCNKGYTKNRTHPFTTSSGVQKSNTYLVWTEKGRRFLHDFKEKHNEKVRKLLALRGV